MIIIIDVGRRDVTLLFHFGFAAASLGAFVVCTISVGELEGLRIAFDFEIGAGICVGNMPISYSIHRIGFGID